jgi:hypothetical protein
MNLNIIVTPKKTYGSEHLFDLLDILKKINKCPCQISGNELNEFEDRNSSNKANPIKTYWDFDARSWSIWFWNNGFKNFLKLLLSNPNILELNCIIEYPCVFQKDDNDIIKYFNKNEATVKDFFELIKKNNTLTKLKILIKQSYFIIIRDSQNPHNIDFGEELFQISLDTSDSKTINNNNNKTINNINNHVRRLYKHHDDHSEGKEYYIMFDGYHNNVGAMFCKIKNNEKRYFTTKLIVLLISFLRSNKDHLFRYSILDILRYLIFPLLQ